MALTIQSFSLSKHSLSLSLSPSASPQPCCLFFHRQERSIRVRSCSSCSRNRRKDGIIFGQFCFTKDTCTVRVQFLLLTYRCLDVYLLHQAWSESNFTFPSGWLSLSLSLCHSLLKTRPSFELHVGVKEELPLCGLLGLFHEDLDYVELR